MNAATVDGRPGRPNGILLGAFVSALIINLALLLLIGGLISRREARLVSAPNPQPVNFIRVAPKTEQPTPPPAAPGKPVEASSASRPAAGRPALNPGKSAPSKLQRSKPSQKAKTTAALPGVAAPRIDVPDQGTGPAFAPAAGSDSRLTAPPGRWNPEKQPEASGSTVGGGDGGGGAGDGELVVLSRVLPDYPARAQAQGIEGWVKLDIDVTPAGTVAGARVVAAQPERVFDGVALEAIRRWRFRPAFREGRAVAQRAVLTMKFTLRRR